LRGIGSLCLLDLSDFWLASKIGTADLTKVLLRVVLSEVASSLHFRGGMCSLRPRRVLLLLLTTVPTSGTTRATTIVVGLLLLEVVAPLLIRVASHLAVLLLLLVIIVLASTALREAA
jgi:hypothetical protein